MVIGFLQWWYSEGIQQTLRNFVATLLRVEDFFSLPILVRTWFAPWKNDVLTAKNISLGDQWKLWQQNFASRVVGFILRTIVILMAIVTLAATTIGAGLLLITWIILPGLVFILPLIASVVITR